RAGPGQGAPASGRRASPFLGAGPPTLRSNPPTRLPRPRRGSDPQPLHEREHRRPPSTPHQLVDHLRAAVTDLRDDEENVRLPVQVRDRVYIADSDVSADRSILEKSVNPAALRGLIDQQDSTHHHFLEVCVPGAGGELVATVLLQIRVRGRTLSLMFAACALTRTPDDFRKVDEYGQHGKRAVLGAAWRDLFSLPRQIRSMGRIVHY